MLGRELEAHVFQIRFGTPEAARHNSKLRLASVHKPSCPKPAPGRGLAERRGFRIGGSMGRHGQVRNWRLSEAHRRLRVSVSAHIGRSDSGRLL
jgi:hypothetical protein